MGRRTSVRCHETRPEQHDRTVGTWPRVGVEQHDRVHVIIRVFGVIQVTLIPSVLVMCASWILLMDPDEVHNLQLGN